MYVQLIKKEKKKFRKFRIAKIISRAAALHNSFHVEFLAKVFRWTRGVSGCPIVKYLCNVFSALKLLLKRNNIMFLFLHLIISLLLENQAILIQISTFVFLHAKRFYAIVIRYYLTFNNYPRSVIRYFKPTFYALRRTPIKFQISFQLKIYAPRSSKGNSG